MYSFDTAVVTPGPGYGLPAESVKVEVFSNDIAGSSGCGSAQMRDPVTGELEVQPGASEWTLAGMPGWLWVYGPGEGEGGTSLIPSVTTIYKGYCFGIAGYFTQSVPDVQTFLQIAESLQFSY